MRVPDVPIVTTEVVFACVGSAASTRCGKLYLKSQNRPRMLVAMDSSSTALSSSRIDAPRSPVLVAVAAPLMITLVTRP